jgi:hypothetical protein
MRRHRHTLRFLFHSRSYGQSGARLTTRPMATPGWLMASDEGHACRSARRYFSPLLLAELAVNVLPTAASRLRGHSSCYIQSPSAAPASRKNSVPRAGAYTPLRPQPAPIEHLRDGIALNGDG